MDQSLIPLSFVAEYEYCPRSAFYLMTDAPRARDENGFIQEGRMVHQSADAGYEYTQSGVRVESSVRVFSEKLGISGRADIIEFYRDNQIIPIEIKRGTTRVNTMHQIQLALTALCLMEMYPEAIIDQGAVFFAQDRKRVPVEISRALLDKAVRIAQTVNERAQRMDPREFPMVRDDRCQGCCFYDLCYG